MEGDGKTTRAPIVHPQRWPEDLDTEGKRIVVIGSGATAATLIPSIAGKCEHVTMLQRSPTYFRTGRNAIELAEELRRLQVKEEWIHEIVRRKILFEQDTFTRRSFTEPEVGEEGIARRRSRGAGSRTDDNVDKHFTPSYRPWRQRIAFVPDADLFQAIKSGKASVVTDEIDRFTERRHPAEVRRDAEGRHHRHRDRLQPQCARRHRVRDRRQAARFRRNRHLSRHDVHGHPEHGLGVRLFPRQLDAAHRSGGGLRLPHARPYEDRRACRKVVPALRPQEDNMPLHSWIDPENFNPGYLMRDMHLLPKRGDKPEWQHSQDYWAEKDEIPAIDLDDPAFVYD